MCDSFHDLYDEMKLWTWNRVSHNKWARTAKACNQLGVRPTWHIGDSCRPPPAHCPFSRCRTERLEPTVLCTPSIPVAAACVFESNHHTVRKVGQGHVVFKLEEGGEEERAKLFIG